jgi:hypothetical protein
VATGRGFALVGAFPPARAAPLGSRLPRCRRTANQDALRSGERKNTALWIHRACVAPTREGAIGRRGNGIAIDRRDSTSGRCHRDSGCEGIPACLRHEREYVYTTRACQSCESAASRLFQTTFRHSSVGRVCRSSAFQSRFQTRTRTYSRRIPALNGLIGCLSCLTLSCERETSRSKVAADFVSNFSSGCDPIDQARWKRHVGYRRQTPSGFGLST